MIELTPFGEIAPTMTALLLGIGMVIGIWGSLISVRKFLRVYKEAKKPTLITKLNLEVYSASNLERKWGSAVLM